MEAMRGSAVPVEADLSRIGESTGFDGTVLENAGGSLGAQ